MVVEQTAAGAQAAVERAWGAIAVFRVEADPREPGAVAVRDEAGRVRFVSRDGGRSWEQYVGDASSSR